MGYRQRWQLEVEIGIRLWVFLRGERVFHLLLEVGNLAVAGVALSLVEGLSPAEYVHHLPDQSSHAPVLVPVLAAWRVLKENENRGRGWVLSAEDEAENLQEELLGAVVQMVQLRSRGLEMGVWVELEVLPEVVEREWAEVLVMAEILGTADETELVEITAPLEEVLGEEDQGVESELLLGSAHGMVVVQR